MSPKFNRKGGKTKQKTHIFNFIIFSKQNVAVLLSNLDQLPSQLTSVYRRSVLFYFFYQSWETSQLTKCLRTYSHCSLTFKALCMPRASNFPSKIVTVTQSTENSMSKLHPGHLLWSLSAHSFYCFSAKPQKKEILTIPPCC